MENVRILVVDDEEGMRDSLSEWLEEDGYDVTAVESGRKAIEKVREEPWNILLIDLKMPGLDGIETMREIKKIHSDLPVLIITAYATVSSAVSAMKEGAYDDVVKPFNPEEISILIAKILRHQNLLKENLFLRKELRKSFQFGDIIGKSHTMQEVFDLIRTVAEGKSTILIQGESGTGKELVARAIHQSGPRKDAPFISISCGALSESLLESELFGHEAGAFTDAKSLKKGKIELADGGTFFLDEVGDISLKTQVDLLRVLQEREFRRVGGSEVVRVDVRVIAATHKDLLKGIKAGRFREDLYYRLNVINIAIPPLRERKEDIPLLVSHFLEKFNIENRKTIERVSEKAMAALMDYDWPGNVRELENAIERSVVVCKSNMILREDLPASLVYEKEAAPSYPTNLSIQEVEKRHIVRILSEMGWNVRKSAKILGIDRITLYRKMERYGISRP